MNVNAKSSYENWEEDECEDGLPDLDLVRRDPLQDDQEPDVGEHREDGRHSKHDYLNGNKSVVQLKKEEIFGYL